MKNKKTKITLAGLFLILVSAVPAFLSLEDGADDSLKNSVIWRISGKDLPGPSYLFGTVHVADTNEIPIHKTVIEQLLRSEILVFESDISDPEYPQKALKHALMENGSLDKILPTEKYTELKRFFREEFSFPLEAVNQMKPFHLASLIGALSMGDKQVSHEEELLNMARKKSIRTTGISTLEKESEILSRISLADQVEYLFDEIESYRSDRSETLRKEILQAYREADIEQIYSLVSVSLKDHPKVFEQLFHVRNASWIPQMISLMGAQSCFFAVGVGHLPGDQGIIRLLRDEGYKVVPVHKDFRFHD